MRLGFTQAIEHRYLLIGLGFTQVYSRDSIQIGTSVARWLRGQNSINRAKTGMHLLSDQELRPSSNSNQSFAFCWLTFLRSIAEMKVNLTNAPTQSPPISIVSYHDTNRSEQATVYAHKAYISDFALHCTHEAKTQQWACRQLFRADE